MKSSAKDTYDSPIKIQTEISATVKEMAKGSTSGHALFRSLQYELFPHYSYWSQ